MTISPYEIIDYEYFQHLYKHLSEYYNVSFTYPIDKTYFKELLEKINNGDKSVIKEFVELSLDIVADIAKEYAKYGISHEDLIQEGALAITELVYDYQRNNKYLTIGIIYNTINNELSEFVASQLINLKFKKTFTINGNSYKVLELIDKISVILDYIEQKEGRKPTLIDLSDELNCSLVKSKMLLNLLKNVNMESLNSSSNDNIELDDKLFDTLNNMEDGILDKVEYESILSLLNEEHFSKRNIEIFEKSFGLNGFEYKTQEQLAREYNISGSRVGQIYRDTLSKLRFLVYKKLYSKQNLLTKKK